MTIFSSFDTSAIPFVKRAVLSQAAALVLKCDGDSVRMTPCTDTFLQSAVVQDEVQPQPFPQSFFLGGRGIEAVSDLPAYPVIGKEDDVRLNRRVAEAWTGDGQRRSRA